jgi:hypothetical protein
MSRFRRARLSHATVVAYLALFVALGGSSYAAIELSKKSVKAKHIAKNAVTSKKVKDGTLLTDDFKDGELPAGAQGAQGPKGDPGPKGDAGADGADGADGAPGQDATELHAFINGDSPASVLHGTAVSVARTGAGTYEIGFGRDLMGCTASAIVAQNTPHAGANATTGPDGNFASVTDDEVGVITFSEDAATATRVDTDFYVQVFC